jgi:uncharacterized membrane protein YphA (DoxX/SURF4 family)
MTLDPVIVLIARLALGWLFLFGALHKLREPGAFVRVLGAYRLVPERLLAATAWAVSIVEALVGIGALLQWAPAYWMALALLCGYAGAMAVNLARGRRFIDCGCGGDAQPISSGLIVRNAVLMAACGLALASAAPRALGWVDAVSVAAGVLACGLIYAAVNQVLAAQARFEEWV